jgi:hypothetical protein
MHLPRVPRPWSRRVASIWPVYVCSKTEQENGGDGRLVPLMRDATPCAMTLVRKSRIIFDQGEFPRNGVNHNGRVPLTRYPTPVCRDLGHEVKGHF